MIPGLFDKGFGFGDSLNLWLITLCMIAISLALNCGSVSFERAAREAASRPVECRCACGGAP